MNVYIELASETDEIVLHLKKFKVLNKLLIKKVLEHEDVVNLMKISVKQQRNQVRLVENKIRLRHRAAKKLIVKNGVQIAIVKKLV